MSFTKTARTLLAVTVLLSPIVLVACGRGAQRDATEHATTAPATRYHCPMHPNYVSGQPGNCPICGMRLVPLENPTVAPGAASATPSATPAKRTIAYYRSPMDPSIRSKVPAKDSMGMDYVPVYEDELLSPAATVGGRAPLVLSPERRALLGVRSEPVRQERLARVIRTVGRLAVDERRLAHVHTKVDGYVEHLYVDFTGKYVKQGTPLLSLYSPDLVATQEEYLLALRAQQQLAKSDIESVARGGLDLLQAARDRLLLWDVRPQDIAELERTGKVRRTLDLYAEASGFVTQKNVVHGMRVTPADTLFDIADLSHLWVLADVYVSDLPAIRMGMTAEVAIPYLPGRTWRGPVTYIAPTVEEKTRTVKVRVEIDNPADALKPDMFADVLLSVDLGPGIVVPDGAVIDAGDRKLVFLDHENGRLEPRDVQLGAKLPNGFQVLSGLAGGDRVVTSANFLLDSESSLKAALSAMAPSPASPGGESQPPAGHQH